MSNGNNYMVSISGGRKITLYLSADFKQLSQQAVQSAQAAAASATIAADAVTTLQPLLDNLTELLAVESNIPELIDIHQNLTELLSIFSNLTTITNVEAALPAINAIDDKLTELQAIYNNLTELVNLENNLPAINAVNDALTAINNVNAALSDISTAADNIAAINTAATNIAAIITAANNIAAIIAAPQAAQDAEQASQDAQQALTDLLDNISNLVPYTGATQNVDLGEFGADAGFITFDTAPTNTPTSQGTLFWDDDDLSLSVFLNGYRHKIGGDIFYPVKNQTGSNIPKGVPVGFAGTVGASGRLLIAPYLADGANDSTLFMGVTAEAIDNGEDGKVLWFGRIRGLDTSAFSQGDILYASTSNAGEFQTAVPQAPNNIVQIAAVVNSHQTQGTIFVRPTFAGNINKNEGVLITNPEEGELLQLQNDGLWVNRNIVDILQEVALSIRIALDIEDGFVMTVDTTVQGTGTVTGTNQIQLTGAEGEYIVEAYQNDVLIQTFFDLENEETLTLPSGGVYDLRILPTGNTHFHRIQYDNGGDRLKVKQIKNWGNAVVWSDFGGAFRGCDISSLGNNKIKNGNNVTSFAGCFRANNLTSIPAGLFDNCPNVTNFSSCFFTNNLTSIPAGLFDNCPNVTNFSVCFRANNLTSIPAGLFNNSTNVTRFDGCFENNNLTSIASGLFDNCPLVNNFERCFRVTNLTSIPAGLFDNCPNVTNFDSCFENNNLTSIPAGLFDNCPNVTDFDSCFSGNTLNIDDLSRLYIELEATNANSNVPFHGGSGQYDPAFTAPPLTKNTGDARADLVARGWILTDGGSI